MISKEKLLHLEDETLFDEIFRGLPEEAPFEMSDEYEEFCEKQISSAKKKTEEEDEEEKWCEQQIEISKMLRK